MTKKQRNAGKRKERSFQTQPSETRQGTVRWVVAAAVVALTIVGLNALFRDGDSAVASPIEFTDVKQQTREFIAYNESIKLTPEHELVKQEALSAIKAPCCSDNSAYTCCCPCNMAKSWWGLSHHLIADEGYGAKEVQAAVESWIAFINPDGFSGDACYTGGCFRPFHRNGCAGMDERDIVY